MGEFDFIRHFLSCFEKARVPVGPGDDCAVLPPARVPVCATVDSVVEGVHFTRPFFRLADVGHKALAVNLSDLAAMGARPRWFLCAVSLPSRFSKAQVLELARGMAPLAKRHRIQLVGGNFTRADRLSVTVTALGEVSGKGPLLRSGARAGDVLYVSGSLGDAALGARLKGRAPPSAARRQKRPEPRVRLGLVAALYARAAIDVSDGFAQDLGHVCAASELGARVSLQRLPLGAALARTRMPESEKRQLALRGGEDYELLLAVPPARASAFEKAAGRQGEKVTAVGSFTREERLLFLDAEGLPVVAPGGYDHFL
jgi:thiamine-monophosphate kinase